MSRGVNFIVVTKINEVLSLGQNIPDFDEIKVKKTLLPPVEKHFIMKTQLLLNFILVLLKALLQCVYFGPHLAVLRTGSWLCAQRSILAELRGPCGWFV